MTRTWVNTVKDWRAGVGGFLLLVLPILVFAFITVQHVQRTNSERIEVVSQNVLNDFEVLLDRINGALIHVNFSYQNCDANIRNEMHRLSFDLPGVEAFAIINQFGSFRCTNWLRNLPDTPVNLSVNHSGMHLTGEEYIEPVSKTGVLLYRPRSDGGQVAALMSSAYLRQVLNLSLPVNDTLVLYNEQEMKPIAINGLISVKSLEWVSSMVAQSNQTAEESTQDYIAYSQQYPDIAVVYLAGKQTWIEILEQHRSELLVVIVMSLVASWGWVGYRHRLVNSIAFQIQIGLRNNEFVPHIQPVVNMKSGEWVGAEVLARWQRGGQIVSYPDQFIPAAEQAGFIKAITKQITINLAEQTPNWETIHPTFYFSINLSPNFMDYATVEAVNELEEAFPQISPKQVRFEITEHGIEAANKSEFTRVIKELRLRHYKFGLDDFGTGQSGLEYFSNLTPDFLKIDRRFVTAIDAPESVDFQLLKTIVQLAKSLHLDIIAEGVETESQRVWLLAQGIQFAQGWLYQKAMPLSAFLEAMENQPQARASNSPAHG